MLSKIKSYFTGKVDKEASQDEQAYFLKEEDKPGAIDLTGGEAFSEELRDEDTHLFEGADDDEEALVVEDAEEMDSFFVYRELIMGHIMEDHLTLAMDELQNLKTSIASQRCIDEDNRVLRFKDAAVREFFFSEHIVKMKQNYKLIHGFVDEIKDFSTWDVYLDKPDKKIFLKKEPGIATFSTYAEVTIDAPIVNVLALCIEMDLLNTWVSTSRAHTEHQVSMYNRLIMGVDECPWPISDRDYVFEATGEALKEEKAIVVCMKSVDTEEWFGHKIPERPKGCVKCDIHKGYCYFEYLGAEQTRLKCIFNADPHMPFLPQWLITWATKLIGKVMLSQMQDLCKQLPEAYVSLMENEKKDFYDRVREECKVFIEDE